MVIIDEVLNHNASLNMSLYVSNVDTRQKQQTFVEAYENWQNASIQLAASMKQLFETLT